MTEWQRQDPAGVRVEWGPVGAAVLAPHCACLVVVNVLSFTTSVTVAVDRGMPVHPCRWGDDTAVSFAAELGATLATGRRSVTAEHPWSLSPAALHTAPIVARLVLPSPNGSAISAAAHPYRRPVLAACLRNASAVGRWLARHGYGRPERPVGVVPAGERWLDGSLRPAIEDALGAGAVVAAIVSEVDGVRLSAEATAVRAMYGDDAADLVRDSASGRELIDGGFAADVELAVEVDVTGVVPVLPPAGRGAAFQSG